jgi:3-hydroxyisobutyrate dehydrogenase-like beta-hydroxyacid dehydrogenase
MGTPMARNLLAAGHPLTVYNRTREKAEALRAQGARVATLPGDAARGAGVLFTMLANDEAVEDVIFGSAIQNLGRGAIHVSASTISVELSKRLADAHAAAGQGYIAAPVLGRPDAAEAKKLWLIAAGPRDQIERCRPLLEALGRGITVAGEEAWQANLVKIAANFVLASMLETLGESFALVRKSGLQVHQFAEILNALFRSPVYENYGAIIADQRYQPAGFKMRLGLKDVDLALAAAESATVPMPLAGLLRDHYLEGIARGHGDEDWAAIAKVVAENAGLDGAAAKPRTGTAT